MNERDRRRRIKRSFIAVTAVAFVVLGVQGYYINQTRGLARSNRALTRQTAALARSAKRLAKQGVEAKLGECSYKADLRERLTTAKAGLRSARKFLREHPNGTPPFTKKLIQESITTQQKTVTNQESALQSLAVLHCKQS